LNISTLEEAVMGFMGRMGVGGKAGEPAAGGEAA
jgi:hypothetical protein